MKNKNHIVVSISTEKTFDKIVYPFVIKAFHKLGIEGISLKITKVIYHRPTANITQNGEKLKVFTFRSRTRQRCQLLSFLFNIVLEDLAGVIREEKEIMSIKVGKEEVKLSVFADDLMLHVEKPEHRLQGKHNKQLFCMLIMNSQKNEERNPIHNIY